MVPSFLTTPSCLLLTTEWPGLRGMLIQKYLVLFKTVVCLHLFGAKFRVRVRLWWLKRKAFACNAGDLSSIPGLGGSPERGHGNSLQYSCLENPQRQRSLAGYSPWGHKELAMTEQLSIHTYNPDTVLFNKAEIRIL